MELKLGKCKSKKFGIVMNFIKKGDFYLLSDPKRPNFKAKLCVDDFTKKYNILNL